MTVLFDPTIKTVSYKIKPFRYISNAAASVSDLFNGPFFEFFGEYCFGHRDHPYTLNKSLRVVVRIKEVQFIRTDNLVPSYGSKLYISQYFATLPINLHIYFM